jgi:plasmid stabilization system protein ParE
MAGPQFHLSRRARSDLDEIATYLGKQSEIAPRNVLLDLWSTFEFLAANPSVGSRRDDLHPHVRMFSPSHAARNYVVFFYQRPDGVEISDIIHASRDWIGMFESGER